MSRVAKRTWTGPCVTTGFTMEDFEKYLPPDSEVPDWMCRAAVDICRSYGIAGTADPAYIANTINRHFMNPEDTD